ncbi:MAG: Maf family protein [Moraxella sp.]|nr:Maf family protein [Moraxella sp.]
MAVKIVLASTSPRRRALLAQAHIKFESLAVEVDERIYPDESAIDYIKRMVCAKADAAYGLCHDESAPVLLITADTIGVLQDDILTKPANKTEAFLMWHKMSNKTHEVWTAVQATLLIDGKVRWQQQQVECTKVTFITLDAAKMEYYWHTGEPQDKAGAYGIQGYGATWVARIEGDYSNVVGLPLVTTLSLIEKANQVANQSPSI